MHHVSIYIVILFILIAFPIFCFICYALYHECKNQHLYINKKENTNNMNYNSIDN